MLKGIARQIENNIALILGYAWVTWIMVLRLLGMTPELAVINASLLLLAFFSFEKCVELADETYVEVYPFYEELYDLFLDWLSSTLVTMLAWEALISAIVDNLFYGLKFRNSYVFSYN